MLGACESVNANIDVKQNGMRLTLLYRAEFFMLRAIKN